MCAPHPCSPLPTSSRSSSGIRWHRLLKEEPGAILPNLAEWLTLRGPRSLTQAVSALPGVIQFSFLPTGHDIVDALPQHRLCHLLRHRTCPWAQYVPRAASVLSLPPVLHHQSQTLLARAP